jgi:hypothetical protein
MTAKTKPSFFDLPVLKGRRQRRDETRVPVRIVNRGSKAVVCRDGDCLDISEAMWLLSLRVCDLKRPLNASVNTS